MKYTLLLLLSLSCTGLTGQITIGPSSLPEIGDELIYTTFTDLSDTVSYKMEGADLNWSFQDFVASGTIIEAYEDITGSDLEDEFPSANMVTGFAGFGAAAFRDDNTVSIVGISVGDFAGFEVNANVVLEEPFKLRKVPFNYFEMINDEMDILVTLGADMIPGLDSIEIPLPGATLDSIRVIVNVTKKEEATAWGTLNVLGEEYEVLKVDQTDGSSTTIEAGLTFLGQILWIDASEFLGDVGDFFGAQETKSYKFLTADDKRTILEIRENRFLDSLGVNQLVVSGRMSAEILSGTSELNNPSTTIVYPNPSSGVFRIMHNDIGTSAISSLQVYTPTGHLVKSFRKVGENESYSIRELQTGNYILRIVNDDTVQIKQISLIK